MAAYAQKDVKKKFLGQPDEGSMTSFTPEMRRKK